MRDPYQVLGVSKSASADEIKSAYRKLAKKLHPDVNQGRKDIEQKFKEVTAAYDLLSDTAKRARFDRGEIDAQGQERGFAGAGGGYGGGGPFGGGGFRGRSYGGGDPFAAFNADDIFSEFMNAARGGAGAGPQAGPGETVYALSISFIDAALGGKKRVTLSNGKTIDVTIPAGVAEGHKLRLRGQGERGGDGIIEMHIEPHPYFTRKDHDIYIDVPVSLPEAVLGASIRVPTLDGHVSVKVPKNANSGTTLRLKGKGVPFGKNETGDMYAKLVVALPEHSSPELVEFMEKWAKKNSYDPRRKFS
jgi:DnaJ-class molecular chaperone